MIGPWQHAVQPLHGTTLIEKVGSFGSITLPRSAAATALTSPKLRYDLGQFVSCRTRKSHGRREAMVDVGLAGLAVLARAVTAAAAPE
jgi:hypothetical protein